MFCGKCGAEIKAGGKFCAVCGTPVREEALQAESGSPAFSGTPGVNTAAPMQTVSEMPIQTPLAPGVGNTSADTPKKGGKAGIFVAIGVAAVLLVVVVSCVVNAAGISNFMHKTFSSPEGYFQYVMKNEVTAASERAGGLYSDMVSKLNFYDVGYDAELTVELGEEVQALMKMAGAYTDLSSDGIDLSKLESFKVGAGVSVKDSTVGCNLTAHINQVALLSLNSVMDLAQGEAYFQIPELSKTYLGLNMEDYDMVGYYYDLDSLTEAQEMNKEIVKALPGQADVEKMIQRYLNVMIENMDDVTIGSKKQLKVEGITQKCTEIKVTIDGKTAKKAMEAVIEEALDDKDLKKIITKAIDATGEDGDEYYDEFADALEYLKTELKYVGQSDGEIVLKIYVDGKGNVIGTEADFGDDRYSSVFTVTKGKDKAYEISLVEDDENIYSLSGKGQTSRGLLTGEFVLEVENQSVAEFKVSNLDLKKWESGYFNGSVEIMPSSEMGELLAQEFSAPIASFVEDASITVDCKASAEEAEYRVAVNYDREKLLSATLTVKTGSGSKASVPDSKSVIMLEDESDLIEYVKEVDWDQLITGLEKTGVFEELVGDLKDAIAQLDILLRMMR
ncbi:MAG: zinc ribbon domain-containing protein [Bacteroidales bacterium]|nr:zinc ribbon domain-containing protein [Lachnoclostridium sp.]MCM1383432.1 zinc ribbon domain-containing protein [Lachnoclostridium sp.]MCM1464281.1 zinc ribbon domain-containing protein [Bacteroidales bacterium]